MDVPDSGDLAAAIGAGGIHQRRSSVAHGPLDGRQPTIVDRLADSFPLLPDESQWLMALMADDIARIFSDD